MNEEWFAVAAAATVVLALAVAAVAGESDGETTWSPAVPDVHAAEPPTEPGVATVDGERYERVQAAIDAAEPGAEIHLTGRFDERVHVETANLTIRADEDGALLDGGDQGTVLAIGAPNVTVEGVWVRGSGYERETEDAGVLLDGTDATLRDMRITEVTFGVWVDGVTGATIETVTIVGRESVPMDERGNGIQLWKADGALVADNRITAVRDGIYYSWASDVIARGNAMWNLRYGVHYMYSNDNRLVGNLAFDNDVGLALMISENLTIVDNVAVDNDGTSGHGILIKDIERSEIRANHLVANGNGLFVYNAQDNVLAENLVMENDVGVHATAGTAGEQVWNNSFVHNGRAVHATTGSQVAWNGSERGNYWSDARPVDLDGDGTSDVRHRPAGTVERLVHDRPGAAVFADSPAFDAVRLAESSFPTIESPGVVDHRPLVEPHHDNWRDYYERDR